MYTLQTLEAIKRGTHKDVLQRQITRIIKSGITPAAVEQMCINVTEGNTGKTYITLKDACTVRGWDYDLVRKLMTRWGIRAQDYA